MKFIRIKKLREQHGYTQKQIADHVGITKQVYANYENGRTRISLRVIIMLSYHYNTSVDYLLSFTDNPAPYPPEK